MNVSLRTFKISGKKLLTIETIFPEHLIDSFLKIYDDEKFLFEFSEGSDNFEKVLILEGGIASCRYLMFSNMCSIVFNLWLKEHLLTFMNKIFTNKTPEFCKSWQMYLISELFLIFKSRWLHNTWQVDIPELDNSSHYLGSYSLSVITHGAF